VAQSLDLALPTPCRIQWRKQLPNGAVLPDESKVMTGMLTPGRCDSVRIGRGCPKECLLEISDRMLRPSTTAPASIHLRRLRFDRRCAESHGQLAAARVENRVLTVAL